MRVMSEEVLWKGRPSQVLGLGRYLIVLLLAAGIVVGGVFFSPAFIALILPLGWALWIFLTIHSRIYELTTERLRLFEGVLNQKIDEIELYRVKDTTMERPFWYRMFGLSTLTLNTSDRSHPTVVFEAIQDGMNVRELLRKQVEYWRDRKRVREVDWEEGQGDDSIADDIDPHAP